MGVEKSVFHSPCCCVRTCRRRVDDVLLCARRSVMLIGGRDDGASSEKPPRSELTSASQSALRRNGCTWDSTSCCGRFIIRNAIDVSPHSRMMRVTDA